MLLGYYEKRYCGECSTQPHSTQTHWTSCVRTALNFTQNAHLEHNQMQHNRQFSSSYGVSGTYRAETASVVDPMGQGVNAITEY